MRERKGVKEKRGLKEKKRGDGIRSRPLSIKLYENVRTATNNKLACQKG